MSFVDKLEIIMGAELYRPSPTYIAKYVMQPPVVHDFSMVPGSTVRMKRYGFWNDPGSYTEDARSRDNGQIIGTGGSRSLPQEEVMLTLREFTGPTSGDPNNVNEPGTLRIPLRELIQAQRNLYDMASADAFHDSIGSRTLFEDYRRWQDAVYINRALSANAATPTGGQMANSRQGGYYNPSGVPNGGTYNASTGVPRVDIIRDVTQVVADMRTRMVPPFQSNLGDCYHALASPNFMRQLRQDPSFREAARYPGIPIAMLGAGPTPNSAPAMPPMMNWTLSPNELISRGGFYGQTGFMHSQVMPVGVFWEGIRWFECQTLPTATVQLTTTGLSSQGYSDGTGVNRTAELAIVFGRDLVGEGVWSRGPSVLLNSDNDYGRFLIAIWQIYAGYTTLNPNNVTVMRTFNPF